MDVDDQRQVDALVLDFGGVLTIAVAEYVRQWLTEARVDPLRFREVMRRWMGREAVPDSPVHRLETGELPPGEFERLLAAELSTVDGGPVSPDGLLRDIFGGADLDQEMVALVRQARGHGLRTALLSNSWGGGYPEDLLAELFDVVVISGRIGLRKPDPAIYRHLLDRLELPAARCVFLDDAPPNVAGAQAVGLHAHRHTDAATTRAALAALVPALATAEVTR